MSGIGSSDGPAGPDPEDRYDDDALAEAIYLSFTASIPIIREPVQPPPARVPDVEPPAASAAHVEPAPAPVPDVEPPAAPPVDVTPPAPDVAPSAIVPPVVAPEPDEDAAGGRVWDLDDLPPATPFTAPPVTVPPIPEPIVEAPRPSQPTVTHPAAAEPDARGPELGDLEPSPWTRLVEPDPAPEPESPAPPADAALPPWSPPSRSPSEWEPPVASAVAAADPAPETDPEPVSESASPEDDRAAPEDPPDAPSVRRDPIPWFDLAAAPPPDPRTASAAATGAPAPPPLVEPPGTDPEPPPEDLPTAEPAPEPAPSPAPVEAPPTTPAESVVVLPAARRPIPPSRPQPGSEILDVVPPVAEAPPPDPEVRLPGARPVELVGVEPTPIDQRAGRAGRLFWLWFAANASVLSVAVGAGLIGLGLSPRQALIAIVLGLALSFLPLGVAAVAGRWSGQPTLVVSRATFGIVGNIVPAVLAVVTRVGWGGVLVWLAGEAVIAALDRSGLAVPRIAAAPGAGLVVGLLAVTLATVGYGLLSRVQFVLGAIVAVLGLGLVALTAPRLAPARILSIGDGPWMLVLPGAVLVFVFVGLAWTQSGADLARYQHPRSSGSRLVVAAGAGAAVPALVLLAWGVLLAASLPGRGGGLVQAPVAGLLALVPVWAAVPVAVLVVLAGVAGASIAAYSGGFALLAAGLRASRPTAALLSGVLVTAVGIAILALDLGTSTVIGDLATTLAIPVAAWAGLFGGEMLLRTRPFHAPSLLERGGIYPDVRVVNLVALVVATAAGLGFASATTPWLSWEGWFFPLLGIPLTGLVAESHLGVLVALGLALLVPIVASVGAVRRRETALA